MVEHVWTVLLPRNREVRDDVIDQLTACWSSYARFQRGYDGCLGHTGHAVLALIFGQVNDPPKPRSPSGPRTAARTRGDSRIATICGSSCGSSLRRKISP